MNLRDLIVGWFLPGFLCGLALTIILFGTGCAHKTGRHSPPADTAITAAALNGRHIDDKAVIVEQWLHTH